ncbi:energy-coupling factor transport system ATP-binding protein [Treponema bryantii]|uniref:Energy-coupling factor transport system ATP-binding protein n=1 Tax=Treponema bryantii TaxID=163 RepID=A0A1H9FIZ5_9SPIR|nr:energy-coupling factor transporter ATPase [Treponema bryantii]SEQ37930.1 energy-coupling factor transport system ATP-binding protein [Treponema bryantii]
MIKIDDVSFSYSGKAKNQNCLKHINLEIKDGEFVVLCGKSGCGKTTFTRIINGLAPHFYDGQMEGHVYINDIDVPREPITKISTLVGSVFQNPKSQFFHIDTTSELVFGCENQNMDKEKIKAQLESTVTDFQIKPLLDRSLFELSGGEKQQIACGSVYTARPDIFVMDEPTSNLDKKAINRLQKILTKLKSEEKTIIVSEHRLYFLMDLADRFIYLKDGQIEREFTNAQMKALSEEELHKLGLRTTNLNLIRATPVSVRNKQSAISVSDLSCQRGNSTILDIDDLKLPAKSVIALIGDNGTGKSTFAEALCGTLKSNGTISLDNEVLSDKQRAEKSFMVMQDVNHQLFCDSVLQELKLNSKVSDEEACSVLRKLGIEEYKDRHPSSLSGGQKQRVAIASALCSGKKIIYYDEPTSGLDFEGMQNFSKIVKETDSEVEASVIITHDLELILSCCDYVVHIERGRLVSAYPLDKEGIAKVRYFFTTESEEAFTQKRDNSSSIVRLINRMGKYRKYFYGAIVCMVLGVLASIVPYLMIYKITDGLLNSVSFNLKTIAIILSGILGGGLLHIFLYTQGLSLSHKAAFNTLKELRIQLKEKLNKQSLGTIRQIGTGALKKLFTDDIESIEIILAHAIPEGLSNLLVSVIVIVFMFQINWLLALTSILVIPIGLKCMTKMYRDGTERMGGYFAAAKRMNNSIIEFINGIEVVKVFNYQEESYKNYESGVLNYKNLSLIWYKVCWPWIALYTSLLPNMLLFTLPLGSIAVMTGQATLAQLILIICLSLATGSNLLRALSFMASMTQVNYKIQSLERVLDRTPLKEGHADFSDKSEKTDSSEDITFENVHFSYKDKEVLRDISFTAKAGEMTAIVGESGSGKSTIARLIAHQYDTDGGDISLGGKKITDLSLSALNKKISFVSQEVFLFNRTIMDNIRIGNPSATDEMVKQAAKIASCDEFIDKLPGGYMAMAGDAGKRLSGGERQRIALARAILKDAPIIILDEATSSIDIENEEKINRAIEKIIENKTVIVIAHKLSALKNVNKIVLIQDGKVIEEGPANKIMSRSDYFKKLYKLSVNADNWKVGNQIFTKNGVENA